MAMAAAAQVVAFAVVVAPFLVSLAAAHEQVNFGYSGWNGPDKWGSLNPDYKLCSCGKNQSPVNIEKKKVVFNPSLKSLDRDYEAANATLVDNGFNVAIKFEKGAGSVSVDGKKYNLVQLHWHTPAEHTIDGERYPIELHLVHRSDDGNTAVVGILYKYGSPDPFLDDLMEKLDVLAKEQCSGDDEVHLAAGEVDPKTFNRHTRKYYRYDGSFSTPPCTENAIWNILGKVRSISKEQVAALQAPLDGAYKNNSRPTQPLNGRIVQLYNEALARKAESHSL